MPAPLPIMEGYLSKRSGWQIKSSWKQKWYFVRDNQLCYRKSKDDEDSAVLVEGDLRLCVVRPMLKKNCFEVISPMKSTVLKAVSEEVAKAWISGLESSITSAHSQTVEGTYSTGMSTTRVAVPSQADEDEEKEAGKNMAKQGRDTNAVMVVIANLKKLAQKCIANNQFFKMTLNLPQIPDPPHPGEPGLLRLQRARPQLGLHQPGHHAVHGVRRHPQGPRHSHQQDALALPRRARVGARGREGDGRAGQRHL